MKKFNYLLFIVIFYSFYSINSFKFLKKALAPAGKRSQDIIKSIAFKLASEYMKSFTTLKDSKIALVAHEASKESNKFISRFIFAENKYPETSSKYTKKENMYFRICVPNDNKFQAYLDVFCPFSPCEVFSDFKNSNLKCLNNLSDDIRKAIGVINIFA